MNTRNLLFILFASLFIGNACSAKAKEYTIKVISEYKHETSAYTQGLFFNDGQLYESTGGYGESTFRVVDLQSGKVLRNLKFANKYFAEGSVIFNGKLYILTWTNKVAFVYNADSLEYEKTYSYPREGWGITTDGQSLIASDGSGILYFLDEQFRLKRSLSVKYNGKSIRFLNELEYIDGKIWANVYTTDMIMIIDPTSGEVEATVDCSGLLPNKLRSRDTDVLNGIAYDKSSSKIYLTGKYWPRLYEIQLVEKR